MKSRFASRLTMLAAASLLLGIAGCGGGDNNAPSVVLLPPPSSGTAQVSGVAATGAAVVGANVSLHCANDVSGEATTDASGNWSIQLSKPQFPCLATLTGGTLPQGVELHSLALAAGRLNITPLTDLVLARIAQGNPASLDGLNGKAIAALASQVQPAQAQLVEILVAQGFPVGNLDIFAGDFQPTKGDQYDDLLGRIALSLSDDDKTYSDLISTIATADPATGVPLPNTLVYDAGALAAMPQINKASLTSTAGTLAMALAAGSNPVGAFVGGGTGNKAVLQLQGLNGVKLHDLKSISIDIQGDEAGITPSPVSPYVSLNLTVDLQCNAAPIPADATLAQLAVRRRILSFDPYYHFIQAAQLLSSSAMSTMEITPSTPGWRISGGSAVGTVAVAPNYNGSETLEGFDYQTYPDACIVDGATGDAGMFRDTSQQACSTDAALDGTAPASCGLPYSGGILFLGNSSAVQASQWKVDRVIIDSTRKQTYRFE